MAQQGLLAFVLRLLNLIAAIVLHLKVGIQLILLMWPSPCLSLQIPLARSLPFSSQQAPLIFREREMAGALLMREDRLERRVACLLRRRLAHLRGVGRLHGPGSKRTVQLRSYLWICHGFAPVVNRDLENMRGSAGAYLRCRRPPHAEWKL